MAEILPHAYTPEDDFNLWELELSITPLDSEGVTLDGLHIKSTVTDPNRVATMASEVDYSCPGGGYTCDRCSEAERCKG